MGKINNLLRKSIVRKMRSRLKNKDFSLFCNNCTGAFILHDLGLRFNSPCVNLFIYEPDYLKLIKSLKHYQGCKLDFIETDKPYPVARLDDITIYFMHYSSPDEAEKKWKERFARVNYDNLFFLLHEREGCSNEILKEFDSLPFENKTALTSSPHPELKSVVYVPDRKINGYLDDLFTYKGKLTGEKYYDVFDFIGWFNGDKS